MALPGQVRIGPLMAPRLAEFISDNADGEEMVITEQPDGIIVAGSLATWHINEDGEVDEA